MRVSPAHQSPPSTELAQMTPVLEVWRTRPDSLKTATGLPPSHEGGFEKEENWSHSTVPALVRMHRGEGPDASTATSLPKLQGASVTGWDGDEVGDGHHVVDAPEMKQRFGPLLSRPRMRPASNDTRLGRSYEYRPPVSP